MKKSIAAALLLGGILFTSCAQGGDDVLENKYNYDLSEYIELAEYKNLPANSFEYSVTDEEIARERDMMLIYYSKEIDVKDRGAESGDILYIDYTASVDGVHFEEGSGTDVKCTLGYEKFLFEDSLYGQKAGAVLSADCTYPEDYEAHPEYAGKDVHFDIKIDSVKRSEKPNYTDDFARAYLGSESIADYEAKLRERLEKSYEKNQLQYLVNQTWSKVYENTVVKEYPEECEDLYNDMISSNESYAAALGVSLDLYLAGNYAMSVEEFKEYARKEAEDRVKTEMICYAIARAENIEVSDEEYTKRATDLALNEYGCEDLAEFEAKYNKATIYQAILMDMVAEKIVELADITITDSAINFN